MKHPRELKFFSINAIATMLERDRGTVTRALRDTRPDSHDAHGAPRWKLSTAVAALSAGSWDGNSNAVADAVEAAWHNVEEMLNQLRKAKDVATARQIARDHGKAVGALDRALAQGQAGRTPAEVGLLQVARNRIIGEVTGELLAACGWTLADAA